MVSVTVVINVDLEDEEDARIYVEQYLDRAYRNDIDGGEVQDWYAVEATKHD